MRNVEYAYAQFGCYVAYGKNTRIIYPLFFF